MKLSYDENYYNDIKYNRDYAVYTLKQEAANQTIWMEFSETCFNRNDLLINPHWFNVGLSIYNKRKDMYDNMDKHLITGQDPIRNFIIVRKMFDAMEAYILHDAVELKKDIIIFIHWEDNRRRDAYYKVLSRKGYRYGTAPTGMKVIMKKFKWKDYKGLIEDND